MWCNTRTGGPVFQLMCLVVEKWRVGLCAVAEGETALRLGANGRLPHTRLCYLSMDGQTVCNCLKQILQEEALCVGKCWEKQDAKSTSASV